MSERISTTVYGTTYYTNRNGEGVYTERRDGTMQQHIGNSQAPTFKSAKQFGAWIRRNLSSAVDYREGKRLGIY